MFRASLLVPICAVGVGTSLVASGLPVPQNGVSIPSQPITAADSARPPVESAKKLSPLTALAIVASPESARELCPEESENSVESTAGGVKPEHPADHSPEKNESQDRECVLPLPDQSAATMAIPAQRPAFAPLVALLPAIASAAGIGALAAWQLPDDDLQPVSPS